MSIILIGLNHRTAPVELREKLTLSGCALNMALEDLRSLSLTQENDGHPGQAISEAVILSTCNRLEVYVSADHTDDVVSLIEKFLGGLQDIPLVALKSHLYQKTAEAAIQHLMRVACGLESMILGEPQILGQVTQAFEDAHTASMTGPILSRLFSQAIHTGKRARTETEISRNTTSVSHAGAGLVMEKLGTGDRFHTLIVGAGEMALLAAQALKRINSNHEDLAFINRTYSHAETLATDLGGKALSWYQLEEALAWADAVICATGAPHTVIYARDVEAILPQRQERPLIIVDIAVPRDVEETVSQLSGVQYYDIDDLQSVVDTNVGLRRSAIPQVERIIDHEMARFTEWYYSRQVIPMIKTLREWGQGVAADEVEQVLNRLPNADAHTQEMISRLAYRLVNRLLHEPTAQLRNHAADGNGYGYAHMVSELFGLDDVLETQQNTVQATIPAIIQVTAETGG